MVLTNAEKQARYRERALHDPDGLLLARVQVLVGPGAWAKLKRIRKRTGWTQREIFERAIALLDDQTVGYSVTSGSAPQVKMRPLSAKKKRAARAAIGKPRSGAR